MDRIARIVVFALGLFMLANGLGFWFALDKMNPLYALSTVSDLGRSSIRADFGGFFIGFATMAVYAAWKRSGTAALGAAMLMLIALTGRLLTVAMDGLHSGAVLPMCTEAGGGAILLWARSLWSRP